MRSYIYMALAVILVVGCMLIRSYHVRLGEVKEERDRLEASVRAYAAENSLLAGNAHVMRLTAAALKESIDSLNVSLDSTRRALKVKDRELKGLGYISSSAVVRDTVTIGREVTVHEPIDTVLDDGWRRLAVSADTSGRLAVGLSVRSEKSLVVAARRVPVSNVKCFIGRLFSKKRTEVTVDVVEKNPYITVDRTRFIEIVD